jgi:hypothetical protein
VGAAVSQHPLTFVPGSSVLHIPSIVGKGLTQGALPPAIVLALTVNSNVRVRPNVFLCLVTLLVVDALITCTQAHHLGTVYRTSGSPSSWRHSGC